MKEGKYIALSASNLDSLQQRMNSCAENGEYVLIPDSFRVLPNKNDTFFYVVIMEKKEG